MSMNNHSLRPTRVRNALIRAFKKQRGVFLWGPPGIGKSELVAGIAESGVLGNSAVIDLRMALMEPTDVRGYPVPDLEQGKMRWLPEGSLPDKEFASQFDTVILFLDELNSAPPATQAATYQLALNRRIGEYHLPDNVVIVAAGNRNTDKGVVYNMPTPLANRFVHLEMEVNHKDWMNWALKNDVHADVIAFLQKFPDKLFKMPEAKDKSVSFPTPRSWVFVSDLLGDSMGRDAPSPEELKDLVFGTIGSGVGGEFVGFLKIKDELPDPFDVLSGKVKGKPVENLSAQYSIAISMTYALSEIANEEKRSDKYWASLDNYMGYIMDALKPELRVMAVKMVLDRGVPINGGGAKLKNFKRFHDEHYELIRDATTKS